MAKEDEDEDPELDPDMIYWQRLNAGLFTVQMADLVIAQLALMDNTVSVLHLVSMV
jgi:hypothetical protein